MDKSYPKKKSLRGPGGIIIRLDAAEIFPNDPGNGTPVLVIAPFGRGYNTYWCIQSEGIFDSGVELTREQMEWLNSLENTIEQWLSLYTKAIERDGREAVLSSVKGC